MNFYQILVIGSFFTFCLLGSIQTDSCIHSSFPGQGLYPVESNINLGEILESFANCRNRITNFANIELPNVFVPLTTFRYFSIPRRLEVFPVELMRKSIEEFKSNVTTYSTLYQRILLSDNIYKTRVLSCQLNLALYPPGPYNSPAMYAGSFLKEPAWLKYNITNQIVYPWRLDTMSKFDILITQSSNQLHYIKMGWTKSVWNDNIAYLNRIYLIIITCPHKHLLFSNEFLDTVFNIYVHCPYCGQCNEFVSIFSRNFQTSFRFSNVQVNIEKLLKTDKVEYWEYYGSHMYLKTWVYRLKNARLVTRKQAYVLKAFQYSLENIHENLLELMLHIHILNNLIGNSTFEVLQGNKNLLSDRSLRVVNCAPRRVNFNFVPKFLSEPSDSFVNYQNLGLVFGDNILAFISCHRLDSSRFAPLLEIITAVDIISWACIVTTSILVVTLVNVSNVNQSTSRKSLLAETFSALTNLLLSLLDQGNSMVQNVPKRNTFAFIATFWIPLCFQVLSNEYKGDNIQRLTVPAPPKAFDRFDVLVNHSFIMRSHPEKFIDSQSIIHMLSLQNSSTSFWQAQFGVNHVQPNEIYRKTQIFSFYFHEIITSTSSFTSPKNLYSRLSNRTRSYLNQSSLFENWKTVQNLPEGFSVDEIIYKLHVPHLYQCRKSAVIVSSRLALLLHSNFTKYKLPVFIGKDILLHTYNGYFFLGAVPVNAFKRTQGFGQSGILSFWKRYLDTTIIRAGWRNKQDMIIHNAVHGTQTSSYIVFCIPLIGCVLGLMMLHLEIIWRKCSKHA